MFDKCRTVKTRILARRRGGIGWRAAFINRIGVMRKFAPLPKSILLVEILGMGLLTLAWLSLNQYVQLPAPIASPTAALVMLFAGIVLMIPAALVVMWRMAQIVAPQLTHSPKPESLSDREKRNDADH